jgi:glucose/arabinose dehydrogenase
MMLHFWLGAIIAASLVAAGCAGSEGTAADVAERQTDGRGNEAAAESGPTGVRSDAEANKPPEAANDPAAAFPYVMEVVADRLNVPWDMDIAPDGRIFFTERPGQIRVIEQGKLLQEPVYQFGDPFFSRSEAGLLGIALDRDFSNNHYLYVYHTHREGGQTKNRVLRMVEQNNKTVVDKVLIDHLPGELNHDGGRIKIGPDGMLYITAGDALDRPLAQNLSSLGGKILRIAPDGSIPPDNPFPGSPVYSLGHRNPQGLAWHPLTGKLFSAEHGNSAHDELNLIVPGANYGWPIVQGDGIPLTTGEDVQPGEGPFTPPLVHSGTATWAPSGIAFITQGPWKGNLLVANLRGSQLLRVILKEDFQTVQSVVPLFKDEFGRIRNVYEAADGSIYIMTNNRDGRGNPRGDDDKIIRFRPDARR